MLNGSTRSTSGSLLQDRMRAFFLVVLAAMAVGSQAMDLESEVKRLIESFRGIMPVGVPQAGIPVLEPFLLDTFNLDIKVSPFSAKFTGNNILIPGVSGFTFTKISQIQGTNKVAVAVELPDITVTGDYIMKGKVKVGVSVKLNGDGPLRLTLKGIKGTATADLQVRSDNTLSLQNLKVDSWTYKEVKIKLSNLINGALSGTVNALLNELMPTLIKSNRGTITSMLENQGKDLINVYLDSTYGRSRAVRPAARETTLTLDSTNWVVTPEAHLILRQLAAHIGRARSHA